MKLRRRISGLEGDGQVGEDSAGVPSQLNSARVRRLARRKS